MACHYVFVSNHDTVQTGWQERSKAGPECSDATSCIAFREMVLLTSSGDLLLLTGRQFIIMKE
jgi:hypothetical protein